MYTPTAFILLFVALLYLASTYPSDKHSTTIMVILVIIAIVMMTGYYRRQYRSRPNYQYVTDYGWSYPQPSNYYVVSDNVWRNYHGWDNSRYHHHGWKNRRWQRHL